MRKVIMAILFIAMVISLNVSALAYTTFDGISDTVYNLESLLEFIEQANDFDKVYIGATIDITETTTVGRDELIRVRLFRADDFTGSIFNVNIHDDDEVKFQNIEIWGREIESESAIVLYQEYQNVPVIFDNVRFEGCKGIGSGGGINIARGNTRIINCTFNYCSGYYGGGVFISSEVTASIENSTFDSNYAEIGNGGAIANLGNATITNSTVFYNSANNGGGIANMGTCEIDGCIIRNNTARVTGGGIHNDNTLIINTNLVFLNEATRGSGRDISSNGTLAMTKSVDDIAAMLSDGSFERIGWYSDDWNSVNYPEEYYYEYTIPSTALQKDIRLVFEYEVTPDDGNNFDDDGAAPDNDTESTPETDDGNDEEKPPVTISNPDDGDKEPENVTDNDNNGSDSDNGSENNDGGYTPPYIPSSYDNINPSTLIPDNGKLEDVVEKVDEPEPYYSPFQRGDAVLDISSEAYLLGYGDGDEHCQDLLTRAQMMEILYRLLTDESREAVYSTSNHFIDCEPDAWYNEAISTIANAGIVVGIGNGKFDPDANLTWSQIITIFARFIELETDIELENLDISTHWSADYIKTAVARGWIDDADGFNPDALVSRGEMVDFINHVFMTERNAVEV